MKKNLIYILIMLCTTSCFDIPEEGAISDKMAFSTREVTAILGRQHVFGEARGQKIVIAGTTFPFQFEVAKVLLLDAAGNVAEDATAAFTQKVPVKIWKSEFTEKETSREELEGKQATAELPILSFTKANELFFNYGSKDIKPGNYSLDINVKNSSGQKIFKDMLRMSVEEGEEYYLQAYSPNIGLDSAQTCTVTAEKKSSDKETLTFQIIEKDGTIVPMDSVVFNSDYYSLKTLFSFSQVSTPTSTTVDLPYPAPYSPYNQVHRAEGSQRKAIGAKRFKTVMEEVDKKDSNGNVILDPITQEPQKEWKPVQKMRYGFQFLFTIYEPGEWLITIKME